MGSSLGYFFVMDMVKVAVYYFWDPILRAIIPGRRAAIKAKKLAREEAERTFMVRCFCLLACLFKGICVGLLTRF